MYWQQYKHKPNYLQNERRLMRVKGNISKIYAHKRFYEITSKSQGKYILFFEELHGKKFIIGDVLEFDAVVSTTFGPCAINPIKKTNLFLEELKGYLQNQSTFLAYVYDKNDSGFLVSYNGFRCFCPYYEIVIDDYLDEDEIINSYRKFQVLSIFENSVILSKKKIIKAELSKLREEEVDKVYNGFKYSGKVKRVQGYGVFITYCYSEGLLHAINITDSYSNKLDKNKKNEIQDKLNKIFTKGRDIHVVVKNTDGNRYSVILDREDQNNTDIFEELIENNLR
jgi:ribosomal protein S1